MAGSTRKSLAGSAAAAAKRVLGRRSPSTQDAPEAPAKTAPATKTATKTAAKTAAKKTAAKKSAPARKAAATKAAPAPAKKAPASKTATKTAAKKAAPAKAAEKKTPAKKAASAKKASATKTAAKKSAAKKSAPTKKTTPSTPATAKKASPVTKAAPAKKAAPRKATPARLVVLDGEDPWTRSELNEVVKELREHHERLSVSVDQFEEELAGLMRDAGDGAGQDQADVGATTFERDHELTVLGRERETLVQIDRALSHIEDGSYGVCESCGNPIGKNRLMAVPHATLCMSCKQREERR